MRCLSPTQSSPSLLPLPASLTNTTTSPLPPSPAPPHSLLLSCRNTFLCGCFRRTRHSLPARACSSRICRSKSSTPSTTPSQPRNLCPTASKAKRTRQHLPSSILRLVCCFRLRWLALPRALWMCPWGICLLLCLHSTCAPSTTPTACRRCQRCSTLLPGKHTQALLSDRPRRTTR